MSDLQPRCMVRAVPPWALLLSSLMLALAGCAGSSPSQSEFGPEQAWPEVQPHEEILNILNGEADTADRFASTVFVSLSPQERCSGVLIHPRLVLTAGHCVCRGREDRGTTILDHLNCEKTATVMAGRAVGDFKLYTGLVKPHPDFKVVLQRKKLLLPREANVEHLIDESGRRYVFVDVVVTSKADLAVVELNRPIEKRFSPAPLAQSDIALNDRVIAAGYGADVIKSGMADLSSSRRIRQFGKNSVSKIDGELFMLEAPGALPLPGDSGGPCFREEATGMVLVGVNSRSSPGRKASFTSTYSYLDWLKRELEQVALQKPDTP